MADAELVGDVVRFLKTHMEVYSMDEKPGWMKMDGASGPYFMNFVPVPAWADREKKIAAWTAECIKRFVK